MSYKRIGIVRLSAIGDVTMIVPMVRVLQSKFPQAKITWVIDSVAHSLLEGLSGVNFEVINKPRSLKDYLKIRRQLNAYRFDVLLAMQASLRVNFIYPLIKAKRKIGFDAARAKDFHRFFITESISNKPAHLLDGFMSFAEHLGAPKPSTINWQLPIEDNHYQKALTLVNKPYIVINPAASKSERNWPIESYIQLITAIQKKYPQHQVVLTGAKGDLDFIKPITQSIELRSLVGKTSLKELAAILAKASCLIAPDTGPAHIATAMDTPVIGLYAVITARLSGPYLSLDLVIDKYQQAVKKYLNQDPQNITWGTRVHHPKAMTLISVDDVMEKLAMVIK